MGKIYFTITGTNHYHGFDFLKEGMKVELVKEPDNAYDAEAIMVRLAPFGKIGYVANSTYTVLGDCMSAGRLYDKIGKKSYGKVLYATPGGIVCKLCKKKK